MKFLQANRIAPDGTPRYAASHLGLFCLPMSHKRDARRKRVNNSKIIIVGVMTWLFCIENYIVIRSVNVMRMNCDLIITQLHL